MAKVIKEADMGNVKVEESIKQWTLNFTDIGANSNKFYSLEVVKTNKGYFLYTQYGRSGVLKPRNIANVPIKLMQNLKLPKSLKLKPRKDM